MLNNKRSYAFDFDGNLVFTKDTIFLLKRDWKWWHKKEVSQKEFDNIQIDGKNWRRLNDSPQDSLINFWKSGNYKKSLLDALSSNQTWPGRNVYIQANKNASPIAKITARGQSPNELMEAHRAVIYDILTIEDRLSLIENMQINLNMKLSENMAIELYLNNNLYLPVQSSEFLNMYALNLAIPTKIRKNIWFERFVWHIDLLFRKYYWKSFVNNPKFSVWFSDDNLQNIQSMMDFIKADLMIKYPYVKFVVYNTNDSKNIKETELIWKNFV